VHEASASPVALENESTVSKAKKDDMLYMCKQLIIPRNYHCFYKSLALERKSISDASETQQHEQETSTANKKKDKSSLAAKTPRNKSAVTGYRRTTTKTKLKIWGKAQRESALRPKSDWGKLERGGKIFSASKSRGPNSNALAYDERALST